ncbi:MAG: SDR family NAD(P)-dependent oxidoreductase, partial [Mycobacteriaceae bacterium]
HRFMVLPLSARTPAALVQTAANYRNWLSEHPGVTLADGTSADVTLADVCLTAGAGRAHFEQRAALVVNSLESARELLDALADDRPAPGLVRGDCADAPKTAWLFPGQGSQYVGMARELFDTEPVFAETMTRCAEAVADVIDRPLLDVIFDTDAGPDGAEALQQTRHAQPAIFAVEMGLARLWQSWGFEPDVLLGHSVGQYAAACVAGVFSLEDGARLLAERGRLFGDLPAGGRMAAIFAAPERVERLTDEFPSLSVAAYNGANTVLSGPGSDLEQAVTRLTADGVRCDWLDTSHAFHSALLDPALDEFEAFANGFEFGSPQRILICNRTGAALGRNAKLDGAYWRRHSRQPVEFAKGVATLAELGCTMLLEVGPQPVLTAAALRAWPDTAPTPKAIPSLRRNVADRRQISEAVAGAYIAGHLPDFAALVQEPAHKIDLPTYPFEHRQYWFADRKSKPDRSPTQNSATRTGAVQLLEDGRIEELAALLDSEGGSHTTAEVLNKLAAQHNRQRSAQSIADIRYEIRWEKSATAPSAEAGEDALWLIVGDGGDSGPLVDALTAGGHRHRVIGLPASDADEESLVAELRAAAEDASTVRILHVAALDSDSSSMRSLLRMQHRVLSGTQRLFRAAAAADLRGSVWVITRGAQRVTDADSVSPEQSSLWGFGRAAALEYPQVWGGLADLSGAGADDWPQLVRRIAAREPGEDQIALREHAVHVPRLVRRTGQPNPEQLQLRSGATYLVTGGLGSIGLEIAGYLAAHGAGQLVLTSRRTPDDATQARIDALSEQHGCSVRVITADVADPHDVARLLATVQTELPPLAGIVHAAGENSTTPLSALDSAELDRVFAGKVWGAWHLSEAIADLKLDFFLSTSSISSVWGSFGQSAYSAANAFLDGLTWRLRERGIAGVSVNFGPWSAGMADSDARAQLERRGVRTLSPADALAGMADVLVAAGSGTPEAVVARIDWARFLPIYLQAGRRSLLDEVAREVPASVSAAPGASGRTALVERLTAAPVQQRRKLVLNFVRDTVAEVTRVDVSEIREEAGFFDLGMDSLMAIELRRQLEQAVGKELPATLAMDYPRLSDVADYLLSDVLSLNERAESRVSAQPASLTTSATDEPIAIIAVACRFPGSPDPDAYWDVLSGGVDAIREIPEDRFDIDEYYDPDQQAPGKIYTRNGGYLDSVDGFDPEFFGISPREAVWMDPQQRLMLEIAWEGIERAGYAPAALRGSRTGVFVGVAANEYAHLMSGDSVENLEAYFITGNALNAIAGRVAFTLGLEGPAMAMDTACSSSLVAVHQASQALHSGDCDMALAGGVNILLSPASMVAASRARMLAPDGHCKTFDAAADGYVRGEGCGVLVLKRLSDAQRDGDRICAVIRSSAVNQDGASSGLTVPNGGAQQRLIASALGRAGLTGGDVDYLEAHGTGTPLGDPIEVQAAAAVYGAGRDPNRPLLMGTAKTNIGHLESAAGVAGLIKVVLSLQNELLPNILHFHNPNPHIPWDSLPVQVVEKPTPWQPNGRPRRAGVSSFGFTGTNAHVLIEEAPLPSAAEEFPDDGAGDGAAPETPREPWSVLPLSARSAQGLVALAQRYSSWLEAHPEASIADVCFTAGSGRSHFEHRAALVANSVHETRLLLEDLVAGTQRPGLVRGACTDPPTTAWFFPGQGSQYPGMARELFDTEPVFAEVVRRCAEAVDPMLPRPLLDVLLSTDRDAVETLRHTSFAQPAIFAVEMGLARLWQSWGIEPDVVLGHSVGQYAAACVAGVFTLEDGARLIAERGRLFGSLPAGGRMVAVFADPEYVVGAAESFPRVSVGAYNGRNTVLSGPSEDLDQIVAACSQDGTRCTWLETSHAFHSELLDPVLDEFEAFAAQFTYAAPTLPLVCNRTGAVLAADTPLDAQYWRKHSRQPVQFTESVATVAALGCSVLMEIGPQPILTAGALQIWPESAAVPTAIVSLRKGANAQRQMTEALAAAYIHGHRPDFAARQHTPGTRLELPTYPFQRRRYWPKVSGIRSDGTAASGILGSAKDLASGDTVYSTVVSVKTQPWLAHHVIYGTVVVPGATYAAMALAAAGAPARVKEVFFYEPIILPEKASREVQLTMHPLDSEGGWKFQVHSRPYGVRDAEWSLNSDGTVLTGADAEADAVTSPDPVDEAIERLTRINPQQLFETFNDMELAWGPTWSGSLKSLWTGDGEAIGDVSVGEELAEHLGSEPIHPVLLDLCTGVAFPAFPALLAAEHGVSDLFLPLRYGQVELRERMPRRFYCRARWHAGGVDGETQVFDIDFLDRDGHRLGGISEFTVKRAPREALLRGLGGDATRLLYTLGWHESAAPDSVDTDERAKTTDGTWLIAGFDELAAKLPGTVRLAPAADRHAWQQAFTDAAGTGKPVTGIVWRSPGQPGVDVSGEELAARLETEIGTLLAAAQTALAEEKLNLPGGLWIITERAVATEPGEPVDPVNAALWGLGRTIIAEQPTLRCRLVDVDASDDSATWLAGALGTPVVEPEVAVRQGKFLVPRLLHWARSGHLPMPRSDDYVLAPTERGAIDNLRLTETDVEPPAANEVQVRVEAAGLNFRDILNVLGLYPGDPGPIGGDLCGIVTQIGSEVSGFEVGQRVFGSMQGAFASRLNVPVQLLAPVPPGIDPVGAATIPAAALTARLAFDWAQLKPGDRVLIHAASGGVGMAAIQLARQHGATVFATASAYKRATLRNMGVEYVYDSRTTDFADQILADTGGAGVDVVLNSLTGEGFIEATVRATAKGGRFAEIAKRDIWTAEQMAAVRPDIDYEIVALDVTMMTDPDHIQRLMVEVSEGLASGEWTPVPSEVYPLTEARAAFRRMQQARHIGKIVVQMPKPLAPRADRSYLVTGGLGALGLHTAAYLAQLGAGDIVLTSRRGPDAEAEDAIAAMTERFHCRVHVFTADVGDESEVAALLERIRSELPPLGGVAHLAGVLDDALLPQQSLERFRTTMRPKAFGAHHLHRLTKDDDLEFFILYSSASAVLGSPSQANYACANALLDGIVAQRRAQGLVATAANFGPWGRGGMASSEAALANLSAQGMMPLEPSAALAALGEVVRHGTGQAIVLKANWQRTAKMLGGIRPPLLDQVLPTGDGATSGDSELLRQLQEIPVAQRVGFITEFLQREVQGFLRLAQPPAASNRFLDLGTDSLMAVELRNRLFGQFGGKFDISPTAVFDYPTLGELAAHLVSQLPDSDLSTDPDGALPESEASPTSKD